MISLSFSLLRATIAALAIAIAPLTSVAHAQPDPSPPEMLQDAELTAIAFADPDRGWAVGDRGVIWGTSDGGRSWKLQISGVTCRLEAVQFLDSANGWVVGGWTQPYTHETHGVVLRTRDGGRTWQSIPGLSLPALTHVKFFDARTGWAVGNASSLFPSGVFRTTDGGRTWNTVPKGETLGWVTGDFRDAKSGAVAGLGGTLGLVTSSEIRPTRTPNLGSRYLRRMQLSGDLGGWLVGDGGLVLTTADGGFTWTGPTSPIPDVAAGELDFRALAVLNDHIWIAGAPGTCVVHSNDGGCTWQMQRTDQTVPLRGLTFIDSYRGWAVGSLGTILHTRDGGQTWRRQRSGGTRAAVLGVFSEPARVPMELVALEGGSNAYLTAIEILGRRDQESASSKSDHSSASRTHAAMIAAGGSQADTAWRFPLREEGLVQSAETVLARWNTANDGKAIDRLEEHLVRRIRQWRPEVIVTEDVSPRGEHPQSHLTNQVTLAAVLKASDLTAYSDQITLAGLEPWKVKKVFTVQPDDKQGVVNITPAQWAPRLGRSLADLAEGGRSLLVDEAGRTPRNVGLSLLVDHLPQQTGRRDLMSGINLAPGGEARRELTPPAAGDLEQLSRMAQKRHNVEQLLARLGSDDASADNWLGQIDDLTKGLSQRHSGDILWQLGQRYHRIGKSESGAEAMQLLVERHPQHPLADAAALWMVEYFSSSEIAWRQRKATSFNVRLATITSTQEEAAAGGDSPAEVASDNPVQATAVGLSGKAAPEMSPSQRAGQALALAKYIEKTRPTLYADPALRFPLAVAMRQAGQPRQADKFFQNVASFGTTNPWAINAIAEQWLATPRDVPPKKLLSVVTALSRPKLDGRVDDPLWQVGKSVALKGVQLEEEELPTVAVMAFDDEFLYLAVSCRKAPGIDYSTDTQPRPRDNDLTLRDHVTVLLDIDRDYASYWHLSIDHRGYPADSCFGDASWDPQWFIAAGGDDQWWTAEIAIPLAELGPKKPQVRDVWAAQVQRTIPRHGLQSFSQPAAIRIRPEGFGLMVFE